MEYYYGQEADMFTFYRIPKLLFTDPRYKDISSDAKLLYGLMLDRMGLSLKNKKHDAQGRTYIFFRQNEAMELLAVRKNKIIKLYRELEEAGLIERKRQGLTHPDMIYVGRLTPIPQPDQTTPDTEVGKTNFSWLEKPTSSDLKNKPLEVDKTNFYLNNTYTIESSMNESTYQSDVPTPKAAQNRSEAPYSREQYEAIFKAYIGYENFQRRREAGEYTMDEVDELITLMADECSKSKATIRVAGEEIPRGDFRSRLTSIDSTSVLRILYKIENQDPKNRIINRRAYLITMLYNHRSTDPTPDEAY